MDKIKELLEGLLTFVGIFFTFFGPSMIFAGSFHFTDRGGLFFIGLPLGAFNTWMFMKGVSVRSDEIKEKKRREEERMQEIRERRKQGK